MSPAELGKAAVQLLAPRAGAGLVAIEFAAGQSEALQAPPPPRRPARAGRAVRARRVRASRFVSAWARVRSATSRTARSSAFSASDSAPAASTQRSQSSVASAFADVAGDHAVAHRLARLAAQRIELGADLADDVLEPGEVGLGGAQPHLRLVAAGVQAGDAGGFLEDAPAGGGLAPISSPIWPWRTMAGEREPEEASANNICTSRARTSRPLMR